VSLKLHNKDSYLRAVRVLSKALRRSRNVEHIHSWIAEEALREEEIRLPGFNLFSSGGEISPYHWIIPKAPGDESTLIYAYEAFADRPLGRIARPGEMPFAAFAEESPATAKKMGLLAYPKAPDWKATALLLLAYGQRYTDQVVTVRGGVYSMHISSAYMEVTAHGCYSNFRRAIVPAAVPNHDSVSKIFSVPDVITSDPTIRGLYRLTEDACLGTRFALNTIACGLHERRLTARNILDTLRSKSAKQPRSYLRLGGSEGRMVETTLSGCFEAVQGLRNGQIRDLGTLYAVLVPVAYTTRQFRISFGDPEVNPLRMVRAKTLQRWADKIEKQAERLTLMGINADA